MTDFKKKLGQNFLIDENIKKKLIKSINIKNTDIIIEIGSGEGSLSKDISILSKCSHFIEIEKNYISQLKKQINGLKSKIHNDNILNFNIKDIIKKYKKIRIIGNLPYNIATQILIKLTHFSNNIEDIHFVIQKELANKLTLKNEGYKKLSIIIQNYFDIEKLFDIKAESFHPIPKVMSSLIKLKPKKQIQTITNKNLFNKIITQALNHKRKKICNSISAGKNFEINIDVNKRPDALSHKDFINLYNKIKSKTEDYKNL